MTYISAINMLQQSLEFQLDEATSQQERQQLLREYEQDKSRVMGQANAALQATRVAFPDAGYYRTSDYDFAGHFYHEVNGPFNSQDAAMVDINGRPLDMTHFKIEFFYLAPKELGLNQVS